MPQTIHNPDQYMSDLRQILAQGRKRLGILVGAGAPAGILINKADGRLKVDGDPLMPVISQLTSDVTMTLTPKWPLRNNIYNTLHFCHVIVAWKWASI